MARQSTVAARDEAPTQRFFQGGTALNRVLLEAPYLPRCSYDKTATRIRPREYAIRYPYMQVNRPGMRVGRDYGNFGRNGIKVLNCNKKRKRQLGEFDLPANRTSFS